MNVVEKSVSQVAKKAENKTASLIAKPVERSGGAQEERGTANQRPTKSWEAVSKAQARIREAVTIR
jgi:hypothetical protein